MARISTYSQDTSVNEHDRLIGTDGGQVDSDGKVIPGTAGATKNFTLGQIRSYILDEGEDGGIENDFRYATSASATGASEDLVSYAVNVITGGMVKNLNPEPIDGEWVRIVDLTGRGLNTMINAGPGRKFMNLPADEPMNNILILNNGTASFELVYVEDEAGGGDSTDIADHVGWVIVGAQTTD